MACGTPVLAFRHGSVPEVVEDAITGCVVESVEEAICKIGRVLAPDRGRVRRRFDQRFTAERMAQDYLKIYARLIGTRAGHREDRPSPIVLANREVSPTSGKTSHIAAFAPAAIARSTLHATERQTKP